MKIWNFGSLNIDNVYRVDKFLRPGETKPALDFSIFCGGKGLNQSLAAAKAGSRVWHAGLVGDDGQSLVECLAAGGVETGFIRPTPGRNGHTVIQVDAGGQNCILLYGGANRRLTEEYVDEVLSQAGPDDLVLLQNETNLVGEIIDKAWARGLKTALNTAPMDERVSSYDLSRLTWLIVNEIEGAELAGPGRENPSAIIETLAARYPKTGLLLTLGPQGVICRFQDRRLSLGIYQVPTVDTTAAGDTFTGYFLYGILHGLRLAETLERATMASAICVTRPGAAVSVPTRQEVDEALAGQIYGRRTPGLNLDNLSPGLGQKIIA